MTISPFELSSNRKPVVFGEVLLDVFPDGSERLGGAPFNVAYHLAQFGLSPDFISAIGDDERGKLFVEAMHDAGITDRFIQVIPDKLTGNVVVSIQNNEPQFDIIQDRAWDYIEENKELKPLNHNGLLYFGTLTQRSSKTRETLQSLRSHFDCIEFSDINLRPPYYNRDIIKSCLSSQYVKMNDNEVLEIAKLFDIRTDSHEEFIEAVFTLWPVSTIFITSGEKEVKAFVRDGFVHSVYSVTPPAPGLFIDSVGAGDGFSAVCILGIVNKWKMHTILERAVHFASRICEYQGAIPPEEVYLKSKQLWNEI